MGLGYSGLFENWEIKVAKDLIRKLQKRHKRLKREDLDDLLQECLIHWLEIRDSYKPSREVSRKTFMAHVIWNKLNNIFKAQSRDKRKALFHTVPIDALPEGKFPGLVSISSKEILQSALESDLSKAYQKLTPKQREICRLIGEEGVSPTEAGRRLKIDRSTAYRELGRIRKIFTKAGLKAYLK